MITISEVIEQCAQIIDQQDVDPSFKHRMSSHIRALAAQYAGCIVAEGESLGDASLFRGHLVNCDIDADKLPLNGKSVPLYRAKEPTK